MAVSIPDVGVNADRHELQRSQSPPDRNMIPTDSPFDGPSIDCDIMLAKQSRSPRCRELAKRAAAQQVPACRAGKCCAAVCSAVMSGELDLPHQDVHRRAGAVSDPSQPVG